MKANQLARHLIELGVREKDVVCISGVKQMETFVCILACLKIGAIYSVLDNKSPVERLNKIIETCHPKVLFAEASLTDSSSEIVNQLSIAVINNDTEAIQGKIDLLESTNLDLTHKITAGNPAYIMFTSGSTGFPKGALMTHGNVLNLISWSKNTFGFSPGEILTNVNPLCFDNSVFDLYSALFSGACLVPFTKKVVGSPRLLLDRINELRCTSWFSVPSLLIYLDIMKMFKPENMKHIRRFIFGGEGYPKTKLKNLFDMYSERADIFNVYGPTECTCICSNYKVTSSDFEDLNGLPPLGDMIENFSYLILTEENKEATPDEIGELSLLGPNVGKGYYNDKKRTRDSFVQNPLNDRYDEIMYETGDLVKYSADDGKIHFVGRKDNQIKHMGYRIELDEIELALNRLSSVSQAAVIHGRINGISQIVAVISPAEEFEPDEKIITSGLKEIIPDYMIPTKIHFQDILPKNPNGKVDRRYLKNVYFSEVIKGDK